VHELREGKGRLKTIEPPQREFDVRFRFNIYTEITIPGSHGVGARFRSDGTVESIDGRDIPVGTYQLEADDGEILRVKNVGLNGWVIVALP